MLVTEKVTAVGARVQAQRGPLRHCVEHATEVSHQNHEELTIYRQLLPANI